MCCEEDNSCQWPAGSFACDYWKLRVEVVKYKKTDLVESETRLNVAAKSTSKGVITNYSFLKLTARSRNLLKESIHS